MTDRTKRKLPPTEFLRAFYIGGSTCEEIGAAYGCTPQAVSFRFTRAGYTIGRSSESLMANPTRIMVAILSPTVMSYGDLRDATGHGITALFNLTTALGIRSAVRRLFTWRRKHAGRRNY